MLSAARSSGSSQEGQPATTSPFRSLSHIFDSTQSVMFLPVPKLTFDPVCLFLLRTKQRIGVLLLSRFPPQRYERWPHSMIPDLLMVLACPVLRVSGHVQRQSPEPFLVGFNLRHCRLRFDKSFVLDMVKEKESVQMQEGSLRFKVRIFARFPYHNRPHIQPPSAGSRRTPVRTDFPIPQPPVPGPIAPSCASSSEA